jgi:hypothetical protein
MVRAGTYVEALSLTGKDVTIFGESGSSATFITTNSTARVVALGSGISSQTVLSDLTIRNGLADDGGGMLLANGASPVLRRCRLIENAAFRPAGSTWGGGIRVETGSQLLVEDCAFERNVAEYVGCNVPGQGHGGAISAASGSAIRVLRTAFVDNGASGFEGGFGGAIVVGSGASAVIEDCSFRGNGGYGGGVGSNGAVTIDRCVFTGQIGYSGAAVLTAGGQTIIRSSVFFDNNNWGEPGVVYIGQADYPGEFRGNTVAFNQGDGVFIEGEARNNIIAGNEGTGLTYHQPTGEISCNDVWDNTDNYGGSDLTGIDGNISLDPLFCDAAGRDLHIHQNSPCAPGAGSCGLIGALPVECGVLGVDPTPTSALPLMLLVEPNPMRAGGGNLTLVGSSDHSIIQIVNTQGRVVERLVPGLKHRMAWIPDPNLAAGVYFARVQALRASSVTKFVIIR